MSRSFRACAALVVGMTLCGAPHVSLGEPATTAELSGEGTRCSVITDGSQFPQTHIEHAQLISRSGPTGSVQYCEVSAVISPEKASHIGVVYRLPTRWNSKLLGLGGGGFAGNVTIEEALPGLSRGYATLQTDAGHPSPAVWDTAWALNQDGSINVAGLVDFSFRAIHQMTLVGKQIAARYYARTPQRAYFQGCSQGGHQALTEAQRYPGDFDGIIAGAPAAFEASWVRDTMAGRAFALPQAKLSAAQILLVNKAVLAACDSLDGAKDGIVADPAACHWDPQPLLCHSGHGGDECLTDAQIAAVRAAYEDHDSPEGIRAYGLPRGSELLSFTYYSGLKQDFQLETNYQNFAPAAGMPPRVDLSRNDVVAQTSDRLNSLFGRLFVSDDPDLSAFVARGGKLILWHGLYDPLIAAQATANYYERMRRVTEGQLAANGRHTRSSDSMIFFAAPGVGHCSGGPGPSDFDPLNVMDTWFERGAPPERVIAKRTPVATGQSTAQNQQPITRPLCAWPKLPHYNGSGPLQDAASFTCR